MSITRTLEQESWIKARVATRDLAPVEDAARQLIDDGIAELTGDEDGEHDEMAWAKPYVDEARADIARGDVITLEEHQARNAARLAALRKYWRESFSPPRRTPIPISSSSTLS
jgi:antitoxin ParD1/3/4